MTLAPWFVLRRLSLQPEGVERRNFIYRKGRKHNKAKPLGRLQRCGFQELLYVWIFFLTVLPTFSWANDSAVLNKNKC